MDLAENECNQFDSTGVSAPVRSAAAAAAAATTAATDDAIHQNGSCQRHGGNPCRTSPVSFPSGNLWRPLNQLKLARVGIQVSSTVHVHTAER